MSNTKEKVSSLNNQLKNMVRNSTTYKLFSISQISLWYLPISAASLSAQILHAQHQYAWLGVIVGYLGKT